MAANRAGTGHILAGLGAATGIVGLAYRGITSLLKSKQPDTAYDTVFDAVYDVASDVVYHKIPMYPVPIGPSLPPSLPSTSNSTALPSAINPTFRPLGSIDSIFALTPIHSPVLKWDLESSALWFLIFVFFGVLFSIALLGLLGLYQVSCRYELHERAVHTAEAVEKLLPPRFSMFIWRIYYAYMQVLAWSDCIIDFCDPSVTENCWYWLLIIITTGFLAAYKYQLENFEKRRKDFDNQQERLEKDLKDTKAAARADASEVRRICDSKVRNAIAEANDEIIELGQDVEEFTGKHDPQRYINALRQRRKARKEKVDELVKQEREEFHKKIEAKDGLIKREREEFRKNNQKSDERIKQEREHSLKKDQAKDELIKQEREAFLKKDKAKDELIKQEREAFQQKNKALDDLNDEQAVMLAEQNERIEELEAEIKAKNECTTRDRAKITRMDLYIQAYLSSLQAAFDDNALLEMVVESFRGAEHRAQVCLFHMKRQTHRDDQVSHRKLDEANDTAERMATLATLSLLLTGRLAAHAQQHKPTSSSDSDLEILSLLTAVEERSSEFQELQYGRKQDQRMIKLLKSRLTSKHGKLTELEQQHNVDRKDVDDINSLELRYIETIEELQARYWKLEDSRDAWMCTAMFMKEKKQAAEAGKTQAEAAKSMAYTQLQREKQFRFSAPVTLGGLGGTKSSSKVSKIDFTALPTLPFCFGTAPSGGREKPGTAADTTSEQDSLAGKDGSKTADPNATTGDASPAGDTGVATSPSDGEEKAGGAAGEDSGADASGSDDGISLDDLEKVANIDAGEIGNGDTTIESIDGGDASMIDSGEVTGSAGNDGARRRKKKDNRSGIIPGYVGKYGGFSLTQEKNFRNKAVRKGLTPEKFRLEYPNKTVTPS